MIAAALLALATPAASAHVAIFGYNDQALDGTRDGRVIDLLQRTGAGAYRQSVEWSIVEATPGTWRWTPYDRAYKEIINAGLRPVVVLRSAPVWAQDDPGGNCLVHDLFGASNLCGRPPSRRHLDAWAEFVRRAAKRYPDALGFEIYNEPNLASTNWFPRADPGYYTTVLRVAHDAIKGVDPHAVVVSGGIGPVSETTQIGSMNADRFLREMYASGAKGAMDAIGIHPYSLNFDPSPSGSFFRTLMATFEGIRDQAGDHKTPFWITEFGYHTGAFRDGGITQALQAQYVPEIIRQVVRSPDVDVALLHSLVNFGPDLTNYGNNFGLVWADLNQKLAFGEVERVVPPRLVVTSRPASIRSSCPKPKVPKAKPSKAKARCKTGASVTARVWKSSTTIKVRLTAKRRRTFQVRKAAAAGAPTTIKISAKVKGKPMKPGRYKLEVRAADRFGNLSDAVQRTIRIR